MSLLRNLYVVESNVEPVQMFDDAITEDHDDELKETKSEHDDDLPASDEADDVIGDVGTPDTQTNPIYLTSNQQQTIDLDDLPDLEDVDISECGDFTVDTSLVS